MCPEAHAALDRRLDPQSDRPVAVAFSGGGDSLAALIAVLDWARPTGREVIALTVDHGLQPASAEWTAWAGQTAARLGARPQALIWRGRKPPAGLPAAARHARHQLLADTARRVGAGVIVTGHTADDAGENAVLGQGALQEWSPSPVWPEGRDLFLLRPLLGERRDAIRDALAARDESWIDDPANLDLASPRVRARKSGPHAPLYLAPTDSPLAHLVDARDSVFRLDRAHWRAASDDDARRVLAAAMVCAGGGEAPPRRPRLDALIERLRGETPVVATLCGAKLFAEHTILIVRNAGEAARGGLAPKSLTPHEITVWDGRYEIETEASGLTVAALGGHAARLPAEERRRLTLLPATVRPALPVILGGPSPTCPILAAESSPVRFRALAVSRFLAACGAIAQEKAAFGLSHGATAASVLC